jgi:magnesium transporter
MGAGTIRVASVIGDQYRESSGAEAIKGLPALLREPDASVWVDLAGPSREQVEEVGAALGLHPLIVEDVLEGNQRAKIETTDGVVHIVLFHLDYDAVLVASETDIVLGPGFLLTTHDASWDPRESNHLRGGVESVLRHGVDHLLWAMADDIVDGYFPFADRLGYAIDEVQDAVVQRADKESLEKLFFLKRELIDVRRAISPVREVFNQLTNRDTPLIDEDELVYFRDIYDHVIRLTDELDNYRELASATLDVYLTTINNNLSVIMKRLTGVTVILAGIGAVAGIFGMSEAGAAIGGGEASGFWAVTAFVVGVAAIAALFLRRIDWI